MSRFTSTRLAWRAAALVITSALLIAGIVAWRAHGPSPPPNILFLVIDSLRADRVGVTGAPQRLTPFLDQLGDSSIVFTRAYAPSSWTAPVVASLFTGTCPSEHRVTNFGTRLPQMATLAETLAADGYATSGVTANAVIRALGFERGFERYQLVGEPTIGNPKADGHLVNDQLLRWVDEVGHDRPHFVYLHYMDAHLPYRPHPQLTPPPPLGVTRSDADLTNAVMFNQWKFTPSELWRLEDLYDGEVQYQDSILRELFEQLGRRGFLDNALVIVTADHGEEFGRHGVFGHGATLNESVIHVPLLIRTPARQVGTVSRPVAIGGLTTLVLAQAGVPAPSTMQVEPLSLSDDSHSSAPIAAIRSELPRSAHKEVWHHKEAVVLGTRKLLLSPSGQEVMYDLASDPFERRPLPSVDPTLHQLLDASRRRGTPSDLEPERIATPDAATRERLRAAGYLPDP